MITFDASLPSTITLGGTQLQISSAVTVQGPGANQLTISGNSASRVFIIDDGTAVAVAVTLDAAGQAVLERDAGGAVGLSVFWTACS